MQLDGIDKQILRALFKEGRQSLTNLEKIIFKSGSETMSHTGIAKRITKLEDNEILKVQANTNINKLQYKAVFILMEMSNYDEVDWTVKPADSLDECFFNHDKRYQASIEKETNNEITPAEKHREWKQADEILIEDINKIPIDPKEWEKKPTINSNFYAWFYRKAAIYAFTLKVWLSA